MELSTAKKILLPKISSGVKLNKDLSNDWELSTYDSAVYVKSASLGISIYLCNSDYFINSCVFNSGKYELNGNKIIGNYAVTQNGLTSEDNIFIAEDIIEVNNSLTFYKPSELIDGHIYKSDEGELFLNLGNLQKEVFYFEDEDFYRSQNITSSKDNEKFLLRIDNYNYFLENPTRFYEGSVIKKTSKIKLMEDVLELEESKFNLVQKKVLQNKGKYHFNISKKEINTIGRFYSLLSFKDEYYLAYTHISDQNLLEKYTKLNDGKSYSRFSYRLPLFKKINDIQDIFNFIDSGKERLTEFLNDEIYYFGDINDKEISFLEII